MAFSFHFYVSQKAVLYICPEKRKSQKRLFTAFIETFLAIACMQIYGGKKFRALRAGIVS